MAGGRQTKLTPEVQKRICDAISAGNYFEAAASYGGIDHATFFRWMEKGEQGRLPYREFREAVLKAQADAEVSVVAQWKAQIPESWQAARDFLARRFPERWGAKDRHEIEHSGKVDANVAFNLMKLSDEQFRHVVDASEAARVDPVPEEPAN